MNNIPTGGRNPRYTDSRVWRASICSLLFPVALWISEVAFAAPEMVIASAVVAPGESVSMALRLSSASAAYGGFNASIYLPPDVSVVAVDPGSILPADCVPYIHSFKVGPARGVSVVAFSAVSTFSANGELCHLVLRASATAPPGDYPVVFGPAAVPDTVNGIHAIGSANGAVSVAHTASDGVLTIRLPGTPEDTNGNGIPDSWEIFHFGCITNVTALTDFDHDGLPDYYEYLAKTDPYDDTSCLAIPASDFGVSDFVLQWYSIPDALYTVERGDGAEGLWEFKPVQKNIISTPPLNVYTNTQPSIFPSAFFRILRQP